MLILFLGVSAIIGMPTDIFPEINIPVVSVIWQYTGLSTPEMEQRVTTYSEYSISSNVNGIKDMVLNYQNFGERRRLGRPQRASSVLRQLFSSPARRASLIGGSWQ